MKRQRNIVHFMNTAARYVTFLWIVGTLLMPLQEIRANSASFRSNYQLGEYDILISLPSIPPFAYEENGEIKGIFIELIDAMNKVYQSSGVEIEGTTLQSRVVIAGVYPFQRSITYVADGYTDAHLPYLVNPFFTSDHLTKELGVAYSTAVLMYVNFSMYATTEFAQVLSVFEQQIGKPLADLETAEEFQQFDEFLQHSQRTIEVERAHTLFYPFTTTPSNQSMQSLQKVAHGRIDAYIHNILECDMELARNRIDTTNMEKIPYKKFVVRMVVSAASENGKKTDEILSRLIWTLQGRKASDVPLADLPQSGVQKEVPFNDYHSSEAFKKSDLFRILGATWDPPFTKEFPRSP